MFCVAVIGHSLVPEVVEGPDLDIRIFRKPGGKWRDLYCPQFDGLREGGYDLAFIVLGGNDLAGHRPIVEILEDAKAFIRHARQYARNIRVCTAEGRIYKVNNRFGVVNEEYKSRKNTYNRMLLRLLKQENARYVNLRRPWYAHTREKDGVHFTSEQKSRFAREIVRVSLGVKGSGV